MRYLAFRGRISSVNSEAHSAGFSFMLDLGDREIWIKPTSQLHMGERPSKGDAVEVEGCWHAPMNGEAANMPLFSARRIRRLSGAADA